MIITKYYLLIELQLCCSFISIAGVKVHRSLSELVKTKESDINNFDILSKDIYMLYFSRKLEKLLILFKPM